MRRFLIFLALAIWALHTSAQSSFIHIEAEQTPLNQVLIRLRDGYNLQFSFSDNQLSKHKVTLNQNFSSTDAAIEPLFEGLPFSIQKNGDVYLIIPKIASPGEQTAASKRNFKLNGQVVEAGTFEPLPFSHIVINNHALLTDVQGSFTYTASMDSLFRVRISHLGYYKLDTLINNTVSQKFQLFPSNEEIPEVLVHDKPVERAALIGEESGRMKLNHAIVQYIPGQGDNSVFNLLRLMPGVVASGEQSSDLMVWGSYESHSRVTFDGFTLFGLKNFNDNISLVNPFMVKNIEVFKGGYGAQYGNQTGALVNISGKSGTASKPSFQFNINNTTLNGYLELPLGKTTSVQLAYRQTYYELYDGDNFNIFSPLDPRQKHDPRSITSYNIQLSPEKYRFRDGNIKLTHQFKKGHFLSLSTYAGGDIFKLNTHSDLEQTNRNPFVQPLQQTVQVNFTSSETNQQLGSSLQYNHVWNAWNNTTVSASHSSFEHDHFDSITTDQDVKGERQMDEFRMDHNALQETSVWIHHRLQQNKGRTLRAGLEFTNNHTELLRELYFESTAPVQIDTSRWNSLNRLGAFAEEHIPLTNRGHITVGLRAGYVPSTQALNFDPRISGSLKVGNHSRINASWGIYHQYLYKVLSFDRNYNPTSFWATSSGTFPVLRATHYTMGYSRTHNNLTLSAESYFKPLNGMIRSEFNPQPNQFELLKGEARSYGVDLFARKTWGEHALWASYLLSKTEDNLRKEGQPDTGYQLAPQHQTHEFKVAGLAEVGRFYISANYVYGSGLHLVHQIAEQRNQSPIYSRIDVGATYTFNLWGLSGETGLSILNVSNRKNIRYSNVQTTNIKEFGQFSIYTNAVPFTPIVFLKLKPEWKRGGR
jgi:hypothetical protein